MEKYACHAYLNFSQFSHLYSIRVLESLETTLSQPLLQPSGTYGFD